MRRGRCSFKWLDWSGRKAKSLRDMSKRGLFGITDFYAAKPEKTSFGRGLGNGLADMLKPAFEGSGVRRGLRTDNGGRLLEDFEGFGHNFGGPLAGQLRPQPIARSGPSLAGLELGCKSMDESR